MALNTELADTLKEFDWNGLRTYAKDLGIDTKGKKRPAIEAEILALNPIIHVDASLDDLSDEELTLEQTMTRKIRCIVINNNNNESAVPAKLFTVGNAVFKFLPTTLVEFKKETHIPYPVIELLKHTTYSLTVQTRNDAGNVTKVRTVQEPHYDVRILPPLTQKQLDLLAEDQIRTQRLGDLNEEVN